MQRASDNRLPRREHGLTTFPHAAYSADLSS
jgi:hypothetical protein